MKHPIVALGWLAITGWAGAQTLDIAQARDIDLDGLRGLGPSTTQRILQERERQSFRDWRDLMKRIPGIGHKKAAQLSDQGLRVQGQPYPVGTGQ
ncbi:MAG: ComEA family DNA-binding protein [Limnohabitans sp.]